MKWGIFMHVYIIHALPSVILFKLIFLFLFHFIWRFTGSKYYQSDNIISCDSNNKMLFIIKFLINMPVVRYKEKNAYIQFMRYLKAFYS